MYYKSKWLWMKYFRPLAKQLQRRKEGRNQPLKSAIHPAFFRSSLLCYSSQRRNAIAGSYSACARLIVNSGFGGIVLILKSFLQVNWKVAFSDAGGARCYITGPAKNQEKNNCIFEKKNYSIKKKIKLGALWNFNCK